MLGTETTNGWRVFSENDMNSMNTQTNKTMPLDDGLHLFLQDLEGRNVSALTITAYTTDIRQFITFLAETNVAVQRCDQVGRGELAEYMAELSRQNRSGVTRARKLASLREFFRCLAEHGVIASSPAADIRMPKKERRERAFLRPDEYTRMLSAAGGNVRDFCILQVFLQTGIRVKELVSLRIGDVDLLGMTLHIAGKGNHERLIDLEKKGLQALKSYLSTRPTVGDDHLFLSYQGSGISDRGVKKLVEKYRVQAGITKRISAHSLRHTMATYKAEQGVSAFQIQQWLGHANVATSQIYVHMGRTNNAKKLMGNTSL
jgi:site-specific recombinase XerD